MTRQSSSHSRASMRSAMSRGTPPETQWTWLAVGAGGVEEARPGQAVQRRGGGPVQEPPPPDPLAHGPTWT